MPIRQKFIRGIRDSIPGGYVIGRLPGTGRGPAGLVRFTATADNSIGGGSGGGGSSTSDLFGNIDGGKATSVYTAGPFGNIDGGVAASIYASGINLDGGSA